MLKTIIHTLFSSLLFSISVKPLSGHQNEEFVSWCQGVRSRPDFARSGLKLTMNRLKMFSCSELNSEILRKDTLWLDGVGLENVEFLKYFPHLKQLDLTDNLISDLTPLSGLINLTHLWLGENDLITINPLSGLSNLKLLVLEDNRIKNPMPLSGCRNLQALDLSRNEICSTKFLTSLEDLHFIYLNHNRINSLRHLAYLGDLFPEALRGNTDSVDARGNAMVFSSVEINWNRYNNRQINGSESFRIITLHGNPLMREPWESGSVKRSPYNCPVNSVHTKIRQTCLGIY